MIDNTKTVQYNANENGNTFNYLFDLQMSGQTNMLGAGQYLQDELGFDRKEAKELLMFWMKNYDAIAAELQVEV